jgi:hypothetical protein
VNQQQKERDGMQLQSHAHERAVEEKGDAEMQE